jgi:hypothetical protein
MIKFIFGRNHLNNPLQKFEVKFVSLFETITLGIPCNLVISSIYISTILVVL